MSAVTRVGDRCTGHADFPPRESVAGSSDVFINGKPAHREGDAWATHCNAQPVCHAGVTTGGSATVFINGKPLGRIGDAVDCGSSVASGSPDVFAG